MLDLLIRYILLYSDARFLNRGCCGCDRMDLKLSMQSVPITTNICEFESCSGEVYSIQRLRNKSWKPKCVGSFNMGWWILVYRGEG